MTSYTPNTLQDDPSDYPHRMAGTCAVLDDGVVHLVGFYDDSIPFEDGETRKYYRRCTDGILEPARDGVIVNDRKVDCLACLTATEPKGLKFGGTITGRMSSRRP